MKRKSLYLKFLVHLLHHVNFNVTSTVHLAKIARQNFPNAHVRVISNVKSDLMALQEFFFGRALGEHSRPSRLNVTVLGNFNLNLLRVVCLDWARDFRIFRAIKSFLSRRVSG